MNQFDTLENVKELFKKVDCIGEENCYFCSSKKMNNTIYVIIFIAVFFGTFLFGILVGMILAVVIAFLIEMFRKKDDKTPEGYLINQTEKGLGLIPLKYGSSSDRRNAMMVGAKAEKMIPQLDDFIFIKNENITDIKVVARNVKEMGVDIKLNNDEDIRLTVRKKIKSIPYQAENFSRFVSKYKK